MNAYRLFKPHNPLADRLNDPRGLEAEQATRAANAAVRTRRPIAMDEIDRVLCLLANDLAAFRSSPTVTFAFQPVEIYAQADSVVGLAAMFGRPWLGKAAQSLCKLLTEEGASRPEAIAVHLDAMMLISRDECMGSCILPGLQKLSDTSAKSNVEGSEPALRALALAGPVA